MKSDASLLNAFFLSVNFVSDDVDYLKSIACTHWFSTERQASRVLCAFTCCLVYFLHSSPAPPFKVSFHISLKLEFRCQLLREIVTTSQSRPSALSRCSYRISYNFIESLFIICNSDFIW